MVRTLLELPLAEPIDTITTGAGKVSAIGMKQVLMPDAARVIATWSDGSAAATVHDHGKGKAFAVGTLAGNAWMKTGLKVIPYARGGRHCVYNPENFDLAATKLVRLGVEARQLEPAVDCSTPGVEAVVIDHKDGTLVTLVNWTNAPLKELKVSVRVPAKPREVRSVAAQAALPADFKDGMVTFQTRLDEADYILLLK